MKNYEAQSSYQFNKSVQTGVYRGRIARSRAVLELIEILTGKARSKNHC